MSEYKFSIHEMTAMLNDIGVIKHDKSRFIDNLGVVYAGHPTLNMVVLGEYIDKHGGQDCSMCEYLEKNSSYPIDKWMFYLGLKE